MPGQAGAEEKLERLIGNLLRAGVLLAAAVVLIGAIVYLVRHGAEPRQWRTFEGEPDSLRSPIGTVREALELRGRALIQLGLLLLIATPVARVAFSVFAFARLRDYTYVVLTLVVLAVLLFSLSSAFRSGNP